LNQNNHFIATLLDNSKQSLCNVSAIDIGTVTDVDVNNSLCDKCNGLLINPFLDGVTHINVYSKAHTQLGKFLSNFALSPIETEDGNFKSIEGYWYWLLSKDDRLRKLFGFSAKKLGRSITGEINKDDDEDFKLKIKIAFVKKISLNEKMWNELRNTKVPLTHYYVMNGIAVFPKHGNWLVEFIDDMRIGESNEPESYLQR